MSARSFARPTPPAATSCIYPESPRRPPHPGIAKTALGAEETVPWEHHPDPGALILRLRQQGHEIAAIETSVHSTDLYDWQPRFPVCVLFGHEVDGLADPLLALCDTHVRIPMLGRKHSLNVATAGGVVIYELLRKYRVHVRPGLSDQAKLDNARIRP